MIQQIQQIRFTSKAALKQQCLLISGGNVKEAKELYDFLAEDMKNLPATDPIPPSWQENTKNTLNGIIQWVTQNQSTLTQGIDYVRGLIGKPPISGISTPAPEPLEAIN